MDGGDGDVGIGWARRRGWGIVLRGDGLGRALGAVIVQEGVDAPDPIVDLRVGGVGLDDVDEGLEFFGVGSHGVGVAGAIELQGRVDHR